MRRLQAHELQAKWQHCQSLVPARDSQLQGEMHRQHNNERLRQSFAEKANAVGPWLEQQMEQVVNIGMGGRGSLETAI